MSKHILPNNQGSRVVINGRVTRLQLGWSGVCSHRIFLGGGGDKCLTTSQDTITMTLQNKCTILHYRGAVNIHNTIIT